MTAIIPPRPADTSVEAERVQIDLIRAAPVSRRLQMAKTKNNAEFLSAMQRG